MNADSPALVYFPHDFLEGRFPRDVLNDKIAALGNGSHEAIWSDDPGLTEDAYRRVDIVIASKHEMGAAQLHEFANVRMVSLAFSGYDRVDKSYCRGRGVAAYYAPNYSAVSVAELTIGLTLSVLRRIPQWHQKTSSSAALPNGYPPGTELRGKTVGILGIGRIGTETAKRFRAFDCPVIGWARHPKAGFSAVGGLYEGDRMTLLGKSDVVVLHLPLDAGTEGIIGKHELAAMRRTAILINTARAGLVDLPALVDALEGNRIAGAALDVFDGAPEKVDPRLQKMDNVVLTPHIGFKTREALDSLIDTTIGNIARFFDGNDENMLSFDD